MIFILSIIKDCYLMSTFNIRDLYYDFYEYIYYKSIEYDLEKKFYNNMNLITSIVLCLVLFNLIYSYIHKYQIDDLYGYNTEQVNEIQEQEPNEIDNSILENYEDESEDNDSDVSEDESKLYNLFSLLTNKQLIRIVGNKKKRFNKKELVKSAIMKFKKRMIRDALYQYPYFNFHARNYLAKNEREIVKELEVFNKNFN